MPTGVTVRIRLLVLALLPLTMLVTVITMAPANASRLDASFQDLFNNRMKPISQIKIVADAVAVSVVDVLHKYRAGVFDEERLQQELSGALSRIEKSWADYSADHRTAAEKEIVESLVPPLERLERMTLAYGEQAQVSVQRAREAGKALGLIAQAVEGIAQRNAQISTATEEQTATASEVSQNIDSLNASIGEVAEGAVKTSPSSVELANGLEQQIQRFTVWQARQGASSPALPHRQAFVRRPAGCGRKRRRRPASG